jgi:hypothetical protein
MLALTQSINILRANTNIYLNPEAFRRTDMLTPRAGSEVKVQLRTEVVILLWLVWSVACLRVIDRREWHIGGIFEYKTTILGDKPAKVLLHL